MPRLHMPRIMLIMFAASAALLLAAGVSLAGNAAGLSWLAAGVCAGVLLALCVCGWLAAWQQMRRAHRAEVALDATRTAAATAALRDPLTGLGNYRLFDATLRGAIARAQRYGRPVAILLVEVSVPQVSRTAAHASTYEQVLKYVSTVLQRNLREADTICRLGDTMFGMVLHETELDGAAQAWERLRELLIGRWPDPRPWAASGGASAYSVEIDAAEAMVAEADRRLALEKRRLRADSEP
jgi:diguanylate cyclase (GGDEF)-like protein